MWCFRLILIFIFSALFIVVEAQKPTLHWKTSVGGNRTDVFHSLTTSYDGYILAAGHTNSQGSGGSDGYVAVFDEFGSLVRETALGGNRDEEIHSIIRTFDGNYLVAGYSKSYEARRGNGWLKKINIEGKLLWESHIEYGGSREDVFHAVIQARDGSFVLTGVTHSFGEGGDLWLMKVDPFGIRMWERNFGGSGFDMAYALVETRDGGFAMAGVTESDTRGRRDIWIFKTDARGNPLWHEIYGSRSYDEIYDLVETFDGGFALAGITRESLQQESQGQRDMWLIRTNSAGKYMWDKVYGGRANDGARAITQTRDGGFVLAGYTYSHLVGANTSMGYIVKTDAKGNVEWEDTHGGRSDDVFHDVMELYDGSIVVAGSTASRSEGASGTHGYILKYNAQRAPMYGQRPRLTTENLVLNDENNNKVLEVGELAYLSFDLVNDGNLDAYNVSATVIERNALQGLRMPRIVHIGFVPQGTARTVYVPLYAEANIDARDLNLAIQFSEANQAQIGAVYATVDVRMPEVVPDATGDASDLRIEWVTPDLAVFANREVANPSNVATIQVRAFSDQPMGQRDFEIYVNGAPYASGVRSGEVSLMRGLRRSVSGNEYVYTFSTELFLEQGDNNIEVKVRNAGLEATTVPVNIRNVRRPNLHVLSIGIEHFNLKYTGKDARDFANAFREQEGRIFERVYIQTLISGDKHADGSIQTSTIEIKKAIANLQKSFNYTIFRDDLIVLFISSHGTDMGGRSSFKILPSDFDSQYPDLTTIDFQADIIDALRSVDCQKIIFLDACNSGAADINQGLSVAASDQIEIRTVERAGDAKLDGLFRLMNSQRGSSTLASCMQHESSWEDDDWQNGAFTYSILAAFRNEAYTDEKGTFFPVENGNILTIGALYNYIQRRVSHMVRTTKGHLNATQTPYMLPEHYRAVESFPIFEIPEMYVSP